jgi:hypothetical protein
MVTDRQLERTISSWLEAEAPTQSPDRVLRATFERTRRTRQQRGWRALLWRNQIVMNKLVPIGVGSAAVVVALVGGSIFLNSSGSGGPGGGPTPTPTATPGPTPTITPEATAVAQPTLRADGSLPDGRFRIREDPVAITVDIPSAGWMSEPVVEFVYKNDDSLDPPDTAGAAFLAWAWPVGTGFDVYGDGCHWSTSIPQTAATTPAEIAQALAAQSSSDPTTPVDVTVGGHAGKAITLTVPMTFDVPDSSREERFAECDQSEYGYYAAAPDTEPSRNAQGAGQIDELWILDVDGAIVILDATYSPGTPADLVEETRAVAESATFGG